MSAVKPDYSVTGAIGLSTRLDIDFFSTSDDHKIQWALYLRALAKLQAAGQEDKLGYFSIAGIHNWPYVTWPEGDETELGYCRHSRPTFLPWHRVYMLLFEQRIVAEAMKLAALAPVGVRDQYQEEALKIRQPFWDSGHSMAMPGIVSEQFVYIIIPELSGVNPVRITNPLYSYRFPRATAPRFPNVETFRSDPGVVEEALKQFHIRRQIYDLLTLGYYKKYGPFSNSSYIRGNGSLEQPHNAVHHAVGGYMPDLSVASFDPIFWLHHASIDRYYALWQASNPNVLYEENPEGDKDPIATPLDPFKRAIQGVPWTTIMVQRSNDPHIPTTYDFGYQYPETMEYYNVAERKTIATNAILTLYGPPPAPRSPNALPSSPLYPPGAVPRGAAPALPDSPHHLPAEAGIRREWRVWIEVKLNFVVPNFAIYFTFGETDPTDDDWTTAPNVVGAFHTFKGALETCGNCRDNQDIVIYGTIILTDALIHALPHGVKLSDKTRITEWLTTKLDWRIRELDGPEVKLGKGGPTGLVVGVESYQQAYAPVRDDGSPLPSDLPNILGVTFDRNDHTGVTIPKKHKGGAIKKRFE